MRKQFIKLKLSTYINHLLIEEQSSVKNNGKFHTKSALERTKQKISRIDRNNWKKNIVELCCFSVMYMKLAAYYFLDKKCENPLLRMML